MPFYKKKPVVIEAVQWNLFNVQEIENFFAKEIDKLFVNTTTNELFIKTLDGTMLANDKDFIIKGVNGEYYPCKPDIFEKTYELVQ